MDGVSWTLVSTAAGVGLLHTALGPDHYLPFVMLARARGWSPARTAGVTALCGIGHVGSSLLLGGLGLLAGLGLGRLERLESLRGDLAAWSLLGLGLAYGAWGVRRALRRSRGLEPHRHGPWVHLHAHGDLPHRHARAEADSRATFWTLFAIFALGPCEPLIPLFLLPASRGRWALAALTAAVFGAVTVATMIAVTLAGTRSLGRVVAAGLDRWAHALAGGVIACSGLAVILLGL